MINLIDEIPEDWQSALGQPERETLVSLDAFLADERRWHQVFPSQELTFAALRLTPVESVRAVILGQDPYHRLGQAHGLAFSVPKGVRPPPSLRNIQLKVVEDIGGPAPTTGSLQAWARNGVLLLNTVLTVREGKAGSHRGKGWELVTQRLIETIAAKPKPVAFILWGKAAQAHGTWIDRTKHVVIESSHPSPLSARLSFVGSHPFRGANKGLCDRGAEPIDWRLVPDLPDSRAGTCVEWAAAET